MSHFVQPKFRPFSTTAAPQTRCVGLCRESADGQFEENHQLLWMKHLLYETPALWLDENQPGVQTQRFKTAAEFAIPMIKTCVPGRDWSHREPWDGGWIRSSVALIAAPLCVNQPILKATVSRPNARCESFSRSV